SRRLQPAHREGVRAEAEVPSPGHNERDTGSPPARPSPGWGLSPLHPATRSGHGERTPRGGSPMPITTQPVQFSVDYPDRPLDRVGSAFRLFAAIPIVILLCTVAGGTVGWGSGQSGGAAAGAGGLLTL